VAAGALEQSQVEDALYAAALANGLVGDDGQRQCVVQLHRHLWCSATSWPPGADHWPAEQEPRGGVTMKVNRER
jgi:hypothetical protein